MVNCSWWDHNYHITYISTCADREWYVNGKRSKTKSISCKDGNVQQIQDQAAMMISGKNSSLFQVGFGSRVTQLNRCQSLLTRLTNQYILAKHILDTPIGMSVYFARKRLIGQFNHRPFFKRQIYCRLDKMLTKLRPKSKHREGLV